MNLLLARLGSLVGLAMPASIPRTSGGSMGFPRYRLGERRTVIKQIHVAVTSFLNQPINSIWSLTLCSWNRSLLDCCSGIWGLFCRKQEVVDVSVNYASVREVVLCCSPVERLNTSNSTHTHCSSLTTQRVMVYKSLMLMMNHLNDKGPFYPMEM